MAECIKSNIVFIIGDILIDKTRNNTHKLIFHPTHRRISSEWCLIHFGGKLDDVSLPVSKFVTKVDRTRDLISRSPTLLNTLAPRFLISIASLTSLLLIFFNIVLFFVFVSEPTVK